MGKTRDLFKKIRGTKGKFHAKMGSIKDRNGVDLTEAEDILRRGSKNTQKVKVRKRFKGSELIEGLMNYGWRFVTLYRR